MSAPRWAVGMRKIVPGLYVDAQERLHLDTKELCETNGWPATPENQDAMEQAALELFKKECASAGKRAKVTIVHEER